MRPPGLAEKFPRLFQRSLPSVVLCCFRLCAVLFVCAPPALADVLMVQPNEPAVVLSSDGGEGSPASPARAPDKEVDEVARASLRLFEAQGTGIKLQGLTFGRTEVNGRDVFTAQNGRALSWSDVSSEWMAGVDVHKSPDASMIEGGIGGIVDIRTHLPLQSAAPSRAFAFGARAGHIGQRTAPDVSYLQTHHWRTRAGDFGVLFNVVAAERARVTDVVYLEPFERRSGLAENDVFVPRGAGWRRAYHEQQQRTLATVLQWQPSETVDVYWQSLSSRYDLNDHVVGAGLRDSETGLIAEQGTDLQFDAHGVFTQGSLWSQSWRGDVSGQGVRLNGSRRVADRTSQTFDNSLTFTWSPQAAWALRGELHAVDARTETLDFTVYTSTYVPHFELDLTDGLPSFAVTPQSHMSDAQQYFWNAAMDHLEDNRAELLSARLDFAFQRPPERLITAWRFGGRAHRERYANRDSGYNWGSLSDIWNSPLKYADAHAAGHIQRVSLPAFFSGEGPQAEFLLPSPELLRNFDHAKELLSAIKSGPADEGWSPDRFAVEDENAVLRDVLALYSMLQFDHSTGPLWPFEGHLGLRAVHAQTQSLGFGEFDLLQDDTGSLDERELMFGNGARFVIDEADRDTRLLPSAFLQFALHPRLRWQLATSRTLSRPSADQLRAYAVVRAETETLSLDNGGSQTRVKRWLGSTGSPRLQPIEADQLDTALQWQFGNQGRIYGALFHKALQNSIATRVEEEWLTNGDETRAVAVERAHNVDGASLWGAELGLSHKLGFLPAALRNIAVEGTYTRIDSRAGAGDNGERLPLEGLSANNLNLTGTFQNQHLKLTLAYRWRDDYLLSATSVGTNRPTWHAPVERLDASLALRLSPKVQLGLEAQNLSNATQIEAQGPYTDTEGRFDGRRHETQWTRNERQWRLVLRATF